MYHPTDVNPNSLKLIDSGTREYHAHVESSRAKTQ